jgi:hypothetical protein
MNLTHDGLTLWYGTADAPAPFDQELISRRGATLIVGVHPSRPTNTLSVSYRVDRGIVQTVPGREMRTDHAREIQYFAVVFPPFVTGNVVEYSPVLSCAGRQVPSPALASRFRSSFRLEPRC